MGVHDYSCFTCSNEEGNQCLDDWSNYADVDTSNIIDCSKDYEVNTSSYGFSSGYLFLFKKNPLVHYTELPYEVQIRNYSWDSWDFEAQDLLNNDNSEIDDILGYRLILIDEIEPIIINDKKIYSVWYCDKLKSWIVNMCPTCYEYFINNSHDIEIPSVVLVNIMEKFGWIPGESSKIWTLNDKHNNNNNYKRKEIIKLVKTNIKKMFKIK